MKNGLNLNIAADARTKNSFKKFTSNKNIKIFSWYFQKNQSNCNELLK